MTNRALFVMKMRVTLCCGCDMTIAKIISATKADLRIPARILAYLACQFTRWSMNK